MKPHIQRAFTALALVASLSFAACKSDTPTPQPQPVFPKPDVNPNATPYVTRVLEVYACCRPVHQHPPRI